MRKIVALLVALSMATPVASFAAAPIRPAVTSYAVAGAPLATAGARVGTPMGDDQHLFGGGPAFFLALLAAAAAGAGIYAALHHGHNHPSTPVSPG